MKTRMENWKGDTKICKNFIYAILYETRGDWLYQTSALSNFIGFEGKKITNYCTTDNKNEFDLD